MAPSRLEQLRVLLESDPEDALLHFLLGRELVSAGSHEEAVEPLRRAVALDPDHSAARKELGKALLRSGRHGEAAQALREGIRVAEANGDLQAVREMRVWLERAGEAEG